MCALCFSKYYDNIHWHKMTCYCTNPVVLCFVSQGLDLMCLKKKTTSIYTAYLQYNVEYILGFCSHYNIYINIFFFLLKHDKFKFIFIFHNYFSVN